VRKDGKRERSGRSLRLGDSRAVSETIGFVLAFALVTASVGVVYTTGIGGLEDAREDEQVTNAVRAFEVLADNVADVRRQGAPSRATELKLNGASIGFGDPVRFTVQVNYTDSDANDTFVASTRPLVYEDAGGEVVYSGGATFRVSDDWAAMRVEPGFVVDDRRSLVPLLVTYPQGDGDGIGGDSTVLVVAHRQPSGSTGEFDTGLDDPGEARVNVTVESPRADAWGRYFDEEGMTAIDGDASDGAVTYQFYTERLVVPETVVEFEVTR